MKNQLFSSMILTLVVILPIACAKNNNPSAPMASSQTTAPRVNGGQVTTLAGSLMYGMVNGQGKTASFGTAKGIALDGSGNIYVADSGNNMIRKITPSGLVSTFAGSGAPGSLNGTGTAASFNSPSDVAVDGSGNVYVADSNNSMIRKITAGGVVSTLAGSGVVGMDNGAGVAASFFAPGGLCVDGSGNVYVADSGNNMIRKITPDGLVSTLAGSDVPTYADGTGAAASFYNPSAVCVDGSGNVYVADTDNNMIRKVTSAGVVTTVAGSGAATRVDGKGTGASFGNPVGIAFDGSNNLYVADYSSFDVREVTLDGTVTTLAGGTQGHADGTGSAAQFRSPWGLAIDPSTNTIFVSDLNDNTIRKIQ